MPSSIRGALIVVEGLDRAGKTTQCDRLCQYLEGQGHNIKKMRFPDRSTAIGGLIDAYLKGSTHQEDHVIHLLFSANRWEAAGQIQSDINAGITLVVDRYYYSGIVYSAAKDRSDLTLQWAREPDVGLPRPDVCIFLDVTPEVAAQRGSYGSEKYEISSMQKRVRELFFTLMAQPEGEDIVMVDANHPLEEVQQRMQAIMIETLKDQQMKSPLRKVLPWPTSAHT
ncbi:MAG: hypothetical protein Q9195_004781 [Heterodermia aff. obscurata]